MRPVNTNLENTLGSLVIVGGALAGNTTDIFSRFIELAGGGDNAKIGIISAASLNLKSSELFKADLINYGVKKNNIEIIPGSLEGCHNRNRSRPVESNDTQRTAEKILGYTGIWFVGGDQRRITRAFLKPDGNDTSVLAAMREIYKNGAVIGGTSAGAAAMSDIMITGGDSLGALNYGCTASRSKLPGYGAVHVEKGLGFFKYGIIDQHFNTRARLGRLIMAAYEKEDRSKLAFGIDENTAMIFDNKMKDIEVLGSGGVTVVDVSRAVKNTAGAMKGLRDVFISCIDNGDRLELASKTFKINIHKELTNENEYDDYKQDAVTGVFSPHGLVRDFIGHGLIDNAGASIIKSYCFDENGKGAEISFRKTGATRGYRAYSDGNISAYSFVEVAVDIKPVKVVITDITG